MICKKEGLRDKQSDYVVLAFSEHDARLHHSFRDSHFSYSFPLQETDNIGRNFAYFGDELLLLLYAGMADISTIAR